MSEFKAIILGIPHIPTVKKVNVRIGPSTAGNPVFETPLGVETIVKQVQPDATSSGKDGKIYQWFQLQFPDNQLGWVRDDLIEVIGNGAAFGYPNVAARTVAFSLTRGTPTAAAPAAPSPQPVAPAAPVTPPAPVAPAAPVTPPANQPTPQPAGPVIGAANIVKGVATAICRAKTGANVRSGPGTTNASVGRMNFNDRAQILGSRPDQMGVRLKWVNVNLNGLNGWIREDFLIYEGDYESFGLGNNDQYPSPIPASWWVRDFNLNPVHPALGVEHWGWDYGAETGAPIFAGPAGGTVTKVNICQKCLPTAPSTVSQNLGVSDPRVLSDPAWGFGYGTYIIVRYSSEQLPASTRDKLAARNLMGAHLYVLYGHLLDFSVTEGQSVAASQQIARCGNTGNSEATHLHLEVRAGRGLNEPWSNMRQNLLDPFILFRR